MKLGSLFDGSGTAPLAAAMCGIEPAWASEIELYPIKVTKARFPNMLHLGDITKINGAEVEPVDIICGGSPCQDLSVAGKQKGLQDGERSHLFFEMPRIIKQMREATNGKYPRYIIWENVPGAFSSNKGRDFHAVLQAFAEIADPDIYVPEPESKADRLVWKYAGEIMGDGWSVAWRTVDAQYWGVPQRRRRIYLVADLTGECAGEVLFERTGLSGNSAQGRSKEEESSADVGRSVERSVGVKYLNPWDCQSKRQYAIDGVYRTLDAGESAGGQAHGIVYALQGNGIDRADTAGCNGKGWRENQRDIGRTLDTFVGSPECNQGGMVVVSSVDCRNIKLNEELSCTLQAKSAGGYSLNYQNPVLIDAKCIGNGQLNQISMSEQSNCLVCMHDQQAVLTSGKPPRKYIVRRLTPLECCRLQGFPDWWEDGVEGSDTARYKMWGNGMALPNMLHVMRGIARTEAMGRGREGGAG